ncbi:MAG: Long-chain-fatty-acid--CoA ligase (EC 6.2.1.3) [Olavius algarvensis Delta 4 endosymbiont]|nr:MAG: Long-chain-fatty-acid--CoA ligase (EC 6.2.1.3) [Olavius algarvensis Delta 4 endosymbiont]
MTAAKFEFDGPENLVDLFEQAVEKFRDNKLFGTKNGAGDGYDWITYGQVAERVDHLRGGLAGIGVGKGDGVGIIADNRNEWAIAAYATYGLGARYIPMYEAELPRIMKYIISDSGVKVLLVSRDDILEKVKDFPDEIEGLERIYVIESDGENAMARLENSGRENPVPSIKPNKEDIAGLIYTSGTTGNPKGVLLSHYNLTTNALAATMMLPNFISAGDRSLSFLPWAHSFGQTAELHMLINFGGQTGFAESPQTIVDDLALVRPTLLVAVPRVFNKVFTGLNDKMEKQGGLAKFLFDMGLKAAAERRAAGGDAGFLNNLKLGVVDKIVYSKVRAKFGGRMKMALSSSAAPNPKIAEFFYDIGIPVCEAWGMTELSPAHTVNVPETNRPGSVGKPIPGCAVKIDRSLAPDSDREGEVVAYGPNVMVGYHNLPEATSEVLTADGGLRSGDLGWVDEDGYLYITGRIKEQYKLENGKYVFPVDIEETIKLSMFIDSAMVHGANKPHNVAVVVPDWLVAGPWAQEQGLPEDPETLVKESRLIELIENEVKAACANMAGYEVPRKILILPEPFSPENGILTPTLKLKRREVHKHFGSMIEALYES